MSKWVRSEIPQGNEEVQDEKPEETKTSKPAELHYLRKRVRPARLNEYELTSLKRRKYTRSQQKTNQNKSTESESNKENKTKKQSMVVKKGAEPCVIRCHQKRVLVNSQRRTFPQDQKKETPFFEQFKKNWTDVNLLYNVNVGNYNIETAPNLTSEIKKSARNIYVRPMDLFPQKLHVAKTINGVKCESSDIIFEVPKYISSKPKKERSRIEEILAMQSDRLNDSQYEIYEGLINYIANSLK